MKFLGGLFTFGAHSMLAGMLFIVMLFWWHGRDLPNTSQLADYEAATLSRVYAADGGLLAEFARERRLFTPIDEIPPLVRNAFISAEDKNFYVHQGIDGLGVLAAMADNVNRVLSGRRPRGASTITQQVVKNFLLSGRKQIARKVQEALLAQRIEKVLSKEKILELYLNEIFLGSRAYGVTTASIRYFGKRLEDLEPEEAAYLAALPKAPSNYHPVRQKERALWRRNYVLKEMRENGYLSLEDYEDALATPLVTILNDDPRIQAFQRVGQEPPRMDYFAEEIRRNLIGEMGEDAVYSGGLAVRATVDPAMQDLARDVLQRRLFEYSIEHGYGGPTARIEDVDPEDRAAMREALEKLDLPKDLVNWKPAVVRLVGKRSAEIIIEGVETEEPIYVLFKDVKDWAKPRTGVNARGATTVGDAPKAPGDVWAVGDVIFVEQVTDDAGKTAWSMRQIPDVNGALVAMDAHTGRILAMQGGFSYQASVFNRATQAKRQPGSAFKPFVYAAALENGYQPNSIVLDAPVTMPQQRGETWKPKNYSGRFYGPSPLRLGIEKSQNLMTVRIALDVGLEKIGGYAERFGVYENMPPLVSYALGAGETTLLQMVASYGMFVNGGKLIQPTLIDRIQDRHGQTVFRHDGRICLECTSAEYDGQNEPYVPDEGEQVLDAVTAYQIVSMMEGVTVRGTASRLGRALDFPVAGKTGTTNDARDAWFVGFTPDLVVGCYVGFDNPRPLGRGASGGSVCAPAFEEFMAKAHEGKQPVEFRRPSGVVMAKVDRQTGCAVSRSAIGDQYIWEAFRLGEEPEAGYCPPGAEGIGGDQSFGRSDPGLLLQSQGEGEVGAATEGAESGRVRPRPPRPRGQIGSGSGGIY